MIRKNITKTFIALLIAMPLTIQIAFAHSGRTDSSGGHKDNQNKSGLGSYHYHCGGYPAHLHSNGVCPYSSTSVTDSSTTGTSSAETAIIAAKNEANELGYNAGYEAGSNGNISNDANTSKYSTEYKSGYKSGYEKGKSELESKITKAYDEGYAVGYKCEVENNTYTVQAIKNSYGKGYKEGRKVYIDENTDKYIKYAEEDAKTFEMRSIENTVPSELKEKYTTTYNSKTNELKSSAYDAGYAQALSSKDADSSSFKNEEEVSSYNEGHTVGTNDLQSENNAAYEAGYAGLEYSIPEKFSIAEELLMSSYNKGVEDIKEEKAKQAKVAIVVVIIVLGAGAAGGTFVMKKSKAMDKETLDLNKDEDNID